MSQPRMGTLDWGRRSEGLTGPRERLKLIGNLAFIQLSEGWDSVRAGLGLLSPGPVSLDSLSPPQTALTRDALELAEETHDEALLFHSWRTYYYARLIGLQGGIDCRNDLLFAACILHDLGLTNGFGTPLSACCFAVSGADVACNHLSGCGHEAKTTRVIGDAIALHLNMHVSHRIHGGEAHLLSRGANCDLFGYGRRRIARASVEELLREYPRTGVNRALRFAAREHRHGTRAAVLTGLSGHRDPKNVFLDYTGGDAS